MSLPSNQQKQAYVDFMLHGRRGAAAAASPGDATPSTTPTTTAAAAAAAKNKNTKKVQGVLQAFGKTLEGDVWETDNLLAQVVASIADLRWRLDLIRQELSKRQGRPNAAIGREDDGTTSPPPPPPQWLTQARHHLYNHHHNHLRDDDLHLALQHATRKHEKALQNLRHVLASQGQHLQALGRRLEQVMTTTKTIVDTDDASSIAADTCTRIYKVAALDLYRKQLWAKELLGEGAAEASAVDDDDDDAQDDPRLVAERIAVQWPRSSKSSPWQTTSTTDLPWNIGGGT